jgi:drug/metabolite transporter (DMT)-like permease
MSKIPAISLALTTAGLKTFANIPVIRGITLASLPSLIFIGVFITGFGYSFYFLAMEKTSVATSSIVFYLKPALAPILSLIVLKEAFGINTLIGIGLILISSFITLLFNVIESRTTYSEEEEDEEETATGTF